MPAPGLMSVLTCPACGHAETLEMPGDACAFFHQCSACGTVLRPKPGDCCVFCSYGSVPCPPVQVGTLDCCRPDTHPLSGAPAAAPTSPMTRSFRFADAAGVIGAVLAALCCAGAPIILSVLAALGLGFLRKDAILIPFMSLALVIAVWGFWADARAHGSFAPLVLAVTGAVALFAGVVYVHGFPARLLIGIGAIALVAATLWNAQRRRVCAPEGASLLAR